jgi:sigma-E factor negative regulatory protein RseC
MEKPIEHEGIIASISGNTMVVRIVSSSACSSCAAKGYCAPSESQEKDIYVQGFSGDFASGEQVRVTMQQSMGFKALCIGYLIPFALVLATLIVVYNISGNELASGLSSLLILAPYYLILKLLDQKITKTFGFSVQKMNIA